eukprot:comp22934_c1_seq1/m.36337 comp22934_c1_seq1/g.36337  ORF comp22934_c1_seq1/g.36337 comp22934_c1_seq1/m.36337 type:complete len:507 (-) comp22934_c1_seq1:219-1739(-)
MALSWLVLAVVAVPVYGLHDQHFWTRMVQRSQERWAKSTAEEVQANEKDVAEEQWYTQQTLDHFDFSDTRTWRQRFFVNDKFFKPGSNAPVFLCVGGEGPPLDGSVVSYSDHCNLAVEMLPKTGGLMLALEHRYYGKSLPVPDFTTPNMRYLSSRQALADLAQFHGFAMERFNLTTKNKWVSFGGSYPGMLAGWMRLKYPHLIHAAVASSAPVEAVLDFPGYNNVVGDTLAEPLVGGSRQCRRVVSEGHAQIKELLKTPEGRDQLASKFNICAGGKSLEDLRNQQQFAGMGVVRLPTQSNDPACEGALCNIAKICAFLSDESGPESFVDRLAALAQKQNYGCLNVDYNSTLEFTADTSISNGWGRVWTWQTCTEFGFFQTCEEGSRCPYAQGLFPLDHYTEICKKAFGIPREMTERAIQSTNTWYGGRKVKGSRIMFPNGSVDPWYAQGIRVSPDIAEPTLWVAGASHHAWTHPSKPTDSIELVHAREEIKLQVMIWLEAEDWKVE